LSFKIGAADVGGAVVVAIRIGVGHGRPEVGDDEVGCAPNELTTTSAVSVAPVSSVTVTRTVSSPVAGACMVTIGSLTPLRLGGVPVEDTIDHW